MNRKERNKKYREENKDKIKEYNKKYRKENPGKIKERNEKWNKKYREKNKKYREKNKDKIKEYNKKYREKNEDILKIKDKKYREKHKDKAKNYFKLYYIKNKEQLKGKQKEYNLKKKYGVSFKQFNQKLVAHNYSCAICNIGIEEKIDIYIDHNHITGKNRGLLCRDCNLGLGHFRDSIINLQRTIDYLNNNYDNEIWKYSYKYRKLKKERLKIAQNNKCFICNNEFKNDRDCCLDHNHKTNKIRKLLCQGCNSALGYFKENTIILQKAINYLNIYI